MTERRAQVRVDAATCIGSGGCVAAAPDHFALRDGHSVPLNDEVDADTDAVLAAAESCPVEAITVIDRDTGDTIAPT